MTSLKGFGRKRRWRCHEEEGRRLWSHYTALQAMSLPFSDKTFFYSYILICGHIVPCWRQSQMKGVSYTEFPLRKTEPSGSRWIPVLRMLLYTIERRSSWNSVADSQISRRHSGDSPDVPPATKLQKVTLLRGDVIIGTSFSERGLMSIRRLLFTLELIVIFLRIPLPPTPRPSRQIMKQY